MKTIRVCLLATLLLVLPAHAELAAPNPVEADLQALQDAYFTAQGLQLILKDAKLTARAGDAGLKAQVGALSDRCSLAAQNLITDVTQDLEAGKTASLELALTAIEKKGFPECEAFAPAAKLLRGLVNQRAQDARDPAALTAASQRLGAFLDARRAEKRDPTSRLGSLLRSMNPAQLASWVSTQVMAATPERATAATAVGKVDLNQATLEQLQKIPGVSAAVANAILAYRQTNGAIDGLADLDSIPGIGRATLDRLAVSALAGDVRRPTKEWTLLYYGAGANNLEGHRIDDLQALEQVGSGASMHIVAQLARIEGQDTSRGNWSGVRRFHVKKAAPKAKGLASAEMAALGQVDMADPATLTDFCTWAITHFPSRHVLLVVANHGGGSLFGIASDEAHGGHMISIPQLGQSLAAVDQVIAKQTGVQGAKVDVVVFDACLMAMIEVAYELQGKAKVLCCSEGVSYAGMMDYTRWVGEIAAQPAMDPREVPLHIAGAQADRTKGYNGYGKDLQLSATGIDLDRLKPLAQAYDALGQALATHLDTESRAYTDAATSTGIVYDGFPYRDLDGFCHELAARTPDPDVAAAAKRVVQVLGRPEVTANGPAVAHALTISSDKPGEVVWGIERWSAVPPPSMWPPDSSVYLQATTIKTKLAGPDAAGKYTATFPDFSPASLKVTRIEWRALGARGGMGKPSIVFVPQSAVGPSSYTTFGPESPLLIETNTAGRAKFHGLSAVLPIMWTAAEYKSWMSCYSALAWSRDTSWGKLLPSIGDTLFPKTWR